MDDLSHIPLIENTDTAEKAQINLIITAVNHLMVITKQLDILTKAVTLLLEKNDSLETNLISMDSSLTEISNTLNQIDDKLFNVGLNGVEIKNNCLYNLDDLHKDINDVEDAIKDLSYNLS